MMRKFLSSFFIILLLSVPARAETLQEALADAYKQNPTLLAKRASLRATDEQLAEALSFYRPAVGAGASVGASRLSGDVIGNDDLNRRGAAVTVTQPIFRGGRTVAAANRANFDIQAEAAGLRDTEQNVFLETVTAYMDVLLNRAVLELNQNNQNVLGRQFKATEDRFSIGELTRTDVAQAESRSARASAGVISAEGQLSTANNEFQRVVGRLPSADMQTAPVVDGLPQSREAAISMASSQNPFLLAAQFREKAARELVDQIRGEELPEVNLRGSAGTDWDRFNKGDQVDEVSVVAQLNFPFYQGGAVMARTRGAQHVASQLQLESAAAAREVTERAGRAWDNLATARANIEALNSAVRAAEIALDGVQQEQDVGSRTVLDVLDAEQELLDAKVSLVTAKRDEVVASYNLMAAIGRLNAAELKLPVDLYNPKTHYDKAKNSWFGYSIR